MIRVNDDAPATQTNIDESVSTHQRSIARCSMTIRDIDQLPSEHRRHAAGRRSPAALGTLIEYYDYALYGYVSAIIAPLFFPNQDPVAALLSVLALFALSYVIRPAGRHLLRLGRRPLRPQAGVDGHHRRNRCGQHHHRHRCPPTPAWAYSPRSCCSSSGSRRASSPVARSAARQRSSPKRRQRDRKSRYAAFVPMGTNAGFALASAAVGIVSGLLAADQLNSWGWRIPFLFALPLTVLCYLARRTLPDIDRNIKNATHGFPLMIGAALLSRPLLQATALGIGVQGAAYIGSTFMAIYLVTNLQLPEVAGVLDHRGRHAVLGRAHAVHRAARRPHRIRSRSRASGSSATRRSPIPHCC